MTKRDQPARLHLVHHELADDGFAYSIRAITRLMRMIQKENPAFIGMKQDTLWQEGRLDRHAITHALSATDEGPGFTSIMSLGDNLVMASVLSVAIGSSAAINQPAWRACAAMAEPSERFSDRGQAEARLIFLPEAMLVVPDDDFSIEATVDKAREAPGGASLGSVWTIAGQSHHEIMAGRAAADAAAKLVAGMLNRSSSGASAGNITVDISRALAPV